MFDREKIDTSAVQYAYSSCAAKCDSHDDGKSQRIDKATKLPVWDFHVLKRAPEDENYKPIRVSVPAKDDPGKGLSELDKVAFDALYIAFFTDEKGRLQRYYTGSGIAKAAK